MFLNFLPNRQLRKVARIAAVCLVVIVVLYKLMSPSDPEVTVTVAGKYSNNACRKHTDYFSYSQYLGEVIDFIGSHFGLYNTIPFSKFAYPSDINLRVLVKNIREGKPVKEFGEPSYSQSYANMLEPTGTCGSPDILILVKSAARNAISRDIIRRTWGNQNENKNIKIRVVFLLAKSIQSTHIVVTEAKHKNDILLADFIDNYANNTKKLVHGLQWASKWCTGAHYTMLIDDDYIAFPERIVSFLKGSDSFSDTAYVYMGSLAKNRRPHRSSFIKWSLSYEEYPYDLFPEYIGAGSIIMSRAFLKDVTLSMGYVKHIFNDDIYLSIIAYKLGVLPFHNNLMPDLHKVTPKQKLFSHILTSHGYHCYDEVISAWGQYKAML